MRWLRKIAISEYRRISKNIARLENLKQVVHDLSYFTVASHSGGFKFLSDILEDSLVKGRPHIEAKLKEALIGENNQKLALDAPMKCQSILRDAEVLIGQEIVKEKRKLQSAEA